MVGFGPRGRCLLNQSKENTASVELMYVITGYAVPNFRGLDPFIDYGSIRVPTKKIVKFEPNTR